MGITVYDPSRRTTARTRYPWEEEEERQRALATPQSPALEQARAAVEARRAAAAARPEQPKGLGQQFFQDTAVGRGLGSVVNNPIVKGILQPLDIFGVPQRAIASTINEVWDGVNGRGFSPQDWYDQINPGYFIHGENAQDSIGMGDFLKNVTNGEGTGNRWLDATIGFAGDVATDPLTYFFGAGVVDKGLDAARAGTRLARARAVRSADDVTSVPQVVKQATNPAAGVGSRASLAGRRTRYDRASEATELVKGADAKELARLYGGGEDLKEQALAEIQRRAGSSLGATQLLPNDPVRQVVETALNIRPPRVRFRVPFTSQRTGGDGPGRFAEAFDTMQGRAREGLPLAGRNTRFGMAVNRAASPVDLEKSFEVFRQGRRADPEAFRQASRTIREYERARPIAGRFLVLGQQNVNRARKQILAKIDATDGGRAAYIAQAERVGDTTLNRLFDWVVDLAYNEFGVTIPKLQLSGDVRGYVPQVYHRDFVELASRDERFAKGFLDRFGLEQQQDLLTESGRLRSRDIKPGQDISVTMPDGQTKTFNTGRGTIGDINRNAQEALGIKILEDDPIHLIDDYIQIMSEDVGRRAARAEMIALGDEDIMYDQRIFREDDLADMENAADERAWRERLRNEAAAEQEAAVRRLQARGETDARGRVAKTLDDLDDRDLVRIEKALEDPEALPAMFVDMTREWAQIGENRLVLMRPEVQQLSVNLLKEMKEAGALLKAYRYMNRLFKTYAVLTPGFHARNFMSAAFMNAADGVPFRTTTRGVRLWDEFTKAASKGGDDMADLNAGLEWLRRQDPEIQQAFDAVFGSGAGGRFTESGVVEGATPKRFANWLIENRVTRASQRGGARVEGSVRLGMALDTIEKGGSIQQAANRITRVHFDYSQTSRMDDTAKQIAPFWSFFSRNIPLQIHQQWSRPGAYLRYEHLRDNFMDPTQFAEGEEIPDYILAGRGIPLGMGPFNWFEPDLPHTRIAEDINAFANVGQNPLGITSNMSPVITAPLEFAFGRDAFTGQTFEQDDVVGFNPLSPTSYAALPAAWALGTLEGGDGQPYGIPESLVNALNAVNPVGSRIDRIAGGGGTTEGRGWETLARFMGLPVRTITDRQLDNAALSRRFDEADQRALERALNDL